MKPSYEEFIHKKYRKIIHLEGLGYVIFCWLVWVDVLRPSQQFFSHVGIFSWVMKMKFLAQGHYRAAGEIQTHDLAIKSGTPPNELMVLP